MCTVCILNEEHRAVGSSHYVCIKKHTLVQDGHCYERLQLECHACVEFSSPLQEAQNGTSQNQIRF